MPRWPPLGRHGLEPRPQLVEVADLVHRQGAHAHPPMGLHLDQPLRLEHPEGLPHRRARQVELLRDALLDQALAGAVATLDDPSRICVVGGAHGHGREAGASHAEVAPDGTPHRRAGEGAAAMSPSSETPGRRPPCASRAKARSSSATLPLAPGRTGSRPARRRCRRGAAPPRRSPPARWPPPGHACRAGGPPGAPPWPRRRWRRGRRPPWARRRRSCRPGTPTPHPGRPPGRPGRPLVRDRRRARTGTRTPSPA